MSTITATLRNATRSDDLLFGQVYGDTKNRFADGTEIRTSRVIEELPGDVFVTRNSVYRVESWFKVA